MIIKSAEFINSCASEKDYAAISLPVIAVAGKSNVGKSSFINMLTGSGKLARVSKEAGRTRLVNLFDISGQFILADLPGWGYSAAGKSVTTDFGALTESFLKSVNGAGKLKHIFMLVDIRHEPGDADKQMLSFMYRLQIPFTVLAMKCDKLSGAKINPQIDVIAAALGLGRGNIIPVSSLTKAGKADVLKRIGDLFTIQ